MKHLCPFFFVLALTFSVNAQINTVKDLSANFQLNYIFSNIDTRKIIRKALYNDSIFIKVFVISDSEATPEGYFEGYCGILQSLIISVSPDGDYYSGSKLYKIEGLESPKVLDLFETEYPKFMIKVEYGPANSRKVQAYEFKGIE